MFSSESAFVRGLEIGGKAPVRIQTMYDSAYSMADIDPIIDEINMLASIGCDIIRFSFSSRSDAEPFSEIVKRSPIPVVADIHFDYRLAILALESGADKIRINPGNIGAEWKTREIVSAAKDRGAAIRIGLNSGSLPKDRKGTIAEIMSESALEYIDIFESMDFHNIVVSLKSSDGDETVDACTRFASLSGYPQHIGVTEAGSPVISAVRSTLALSKLLSASIGDTIRISMTGDRENEVIAARELLSSMKLRKRGVRIISCPRCGRNTFDTIAFEKKVRRRLLSIDKDISVAIMGCLVNGPGEAAAADYALTGFGNRVYLYRKGSLAASVSYDEAEDALFEAIFNE